MRQLFRGVVVLIIFSLVIHFFIGAADATENNVPCIDEQKAIQWNRDFNINLSSFSKANLCDRNNELYQLYESFLVLENGQFDRGVSSQFILGVVKEDQYLKWTNDRVFRIRRGRDIPYATAYNSGGSITVQDGWAQLSSLGKVGTLIHEARHTDGYSHTQCRQGPYRDVSVPGCDPSVRYGGAHGVEMEYYARVALLGKNFHPTYQSMARLMLLARGHFVFNQPPIKSLDGLFFRATSGETYYFSKGVYYQELSLLGWENWIIKRGSTGPVLFNGLEAAVVDLYNAQIAPIRDEFTYFKILSFPRPEAFVDVEEFDDGPQKYLLAIGESGALYKYSFGRSQWILMARGSYRQFRTRSLDGTLGVYVLQANSEYAHWDLSRGRLDLMPQKWPQDVVSVAKMGHEIVMLKRDGLVYLLSTGQPIAGLPFISQIVEAPIYEENLGGAL
ncbi:MAG: hypothetical protein KDD61_02575 [Bdellovibrionales bacterium]|nr:hypothetical protein [Bdellovibrionales bacterium]